MQNVFHFSSFPLSKLSALHELLPSCEKENPFVCISLTVYISQTMGVCCVDGCVQGCSYKSLHTKSSVSQIHSLCFYFPQVFCQTSFNQILIGFLRNFIGKSMARHQVELKPCMCGDLRLQFPKPICRIPSQQKRISPVFDFSPPVSFFPSQS